MKKKLCVCFMFACGWGFTQPDGDSTSSMPAKVIGGISDGTSSPPSPAKVLPRYRIHWGVVQSKNDHRVFINRVEPPAVPVKPPVRQLTAEQLLERDRVAAQQLADQKPGGGTFLVFATTYDGRATRVAWNHDGEEFVVWSNVDWKYICGFSSFEGRGRRYDFLLLHSTATAEQAHWNGGRQDLTKRVEIPVLPSLGKAGARYMVVKGDEGNDGAMEFIEAIHDVYAAEQGRLIAAHHERERNRKIQQARNEALRRNPPPKPDVTINYWKRHTPAKPNRGNR